MANEKDNMTADVNKALTPEETIAASLTSVEKSFEKAERSALKAENLLDQIFANADVMEGADMDDDIGQRLSKAQRACACARGTLATIIRSKGEVEELFLGGTPTQAVVEQAAHAALLADMASTAAENFLREVKTHVKAIDKRLSRFVAEIEEAAVSVG